MKPVATVERDASLKGWEVAAGIDDGEHSVVVVYYLDDGITVVGLLSADGDAYVENAYNRDGGSVPNPIVRHGE